MQYNKELVHETIVKFDFEKCVELKHKHSGNTVVLISVYFNYMFS